MNLLELVQAFALRTGLRRPSYVIGNTDEQIGQIQGILSEVIEDVMKHAWTSLTQEALFTTVAGEDQGPITTIAPLGFKWVLQDTIYNRTLRLPVFGPIVAQKWQALKTLPNAGPFYKYRIVRGKLLFNPPAAADHTCAFEYASSHCILGADGAYKSFPTADDDTFILDSTIFLAGLRWKWKHEKGLDYAEEFRHYEELLANAKGRDGTKPILTMDAAEGYFKPGIFVPSGNWKLP